MTYFVNDYDIKNLVFEGGGAKGLAYVGALNALAELSLFNKEAYQINKVAGSSAGAITALLVCLDYPPNVVQDTLLALDFNSLFEISINYIKNVPDPTTSFEGFLNCFNYLQDIYNKFKTDNTPGLNSGEKFIDWLKTIIVNSPKYKGKLTENPTFQELLSVTQHELHVYGTQVFNEKIAHFNPIRTPDFSVVEAIRISMSIPFLFKPIVYHNDYYVDGGVIYNFPINFDDANTPINYTLGFSLNKINKPHQFPENNNIFNEIYLETVALVEDIYLSEVVHYKQENKINNRIVFIDTSLVSTLDFGMDDATKKQLITNGHSATISYFANKIKQLSREQIRV